MFDMNKRIFTGNYEECKAGNLISISGDRGRKIGFIGKAMPKLAPKKSQNISVYKTYNLQFT